MGLCPSLDPRFPLQISSITDPTNNQRFASRSVMAVKTYKIRDKDQAIEAAEHDPAGDEAGVPYYNTPVFTAERAIHIRMGTFNPVNLISAFSIALTIGLLVWAAWIHDGVACVAIGVISLSTSIACLANSWRPQIIERPSSPSRPPGDVIIKTSGGALIVVHCSDEIVRELYFGAEKCDYVVPRRYWSILISISTIMLMVAVVLLGNCSWTMQAAVGVAYIILNGIYWILSVFRAPYSPLFTILEERYDIKKSSKQDVVLESEKTRRGVVKTLANKALLVDQHYNRPSYTRTLAYAIQATQDTRWVWETKAAPDTKAWREWVELAGINMNDPAWNPVSAKDECMGRNANATMQARQAEAMASAVVTPGQPTQNLAVRPQIGPSQTVSP